MPAPISAATKPGTPSGLFANGFASATNYKLSQDSLYTNAFDCVVDFCLLGDEFYVTNTAGAAVLGTASHLSTNGQAFSRIIPVNWGFTNTSVGSIHITAD